ncbi:hypothetical protein IMZ48_20065 [Candidatus Bathyarchaeota archaeon]|nr:hypothetical protein [Candidatus Bathyarchaeota archaeon]
MSIPTEETQVRVASEGASTPNPHHHAPKTPANNPPGAQAFVEAFYHALSNANPLAPFYTTTSKPYMALPLPADISINGTPHPDPASYHKLLTEYGTPRFEVESFDAHVANPAFNLGGENVAGPRGSEKNGSRMSLLVQVAGRVTFGKGREGVKKAFSEVFVLVPNWEALGRNPPRNIRRWLIMSQNLRTL